MRIIILITVFLCFPAWSQEQLAEDDPAEQPADTSATETGDVITQDAAPITPTIATNEPVISEETGEECSQCAADNPAIEANRIAADDLFQQRAMAIGTWFIVIFTGITIILVYKTYREAQNANNIMGEATQKQLRAYITPGYSKIERYFDPEGVAGLVISMDLTNSGQTPAINVRANCQGRNIPANDPIPFFNLNDLVLERGKAITGKDMVATTVTTSMPIERIEHCINGDAKCFVYVLAEYADIFDSFYRVETVLEITYSFDMNELRRSNQKISIKTNATGRQNREVEILEPNYDD